MPGRQRLRAVGNGSKRQRDHQNSGLYKRRFLLDTAGRSKSSVRLLFACRMQAECSGHPLKILTALSTLI